MITGPLFKWFGSKWQSGKHMAAPKHNTIIEPFAGGAGYSLRFSEKNVIIAERDEHIYKLWQWLISAATEADIRAIPINIPEETDIRTLGLSIGQQLLLKNWQRTNNVGNCWTISPWGNKPGQWTANTRSRVAEEFAAIRHWTIFNNASDVFNSLNLASKKDATWFIDPPYQYNYQYLGEKTDYVELANDILCLQGQVIVCEAICPKTDKIPDWLPFTFFAERVTSRRREGEHHHSKELVYMKG